MFKSWLTFCALSILCIQKVASENTSITAEASTTTVDDASPTAHIATSGTSTITTNDPASTTSITTIVDETSAITSSATTLPAPHTTAVIQEIASTPILCLNGGSCNIDISPPYYNCSCRPAYEGSVCQDQKFVVQGNCKYHINHDNKTDLTTANSTCATLGGSLVMIKSNYTQKFLETSITTLYGNKGLIAFWAGGRKVKGSWSWPDGTSIEHANAFTRWAPGFPSAEGQFMGISSWNRVKWDPSAKWYELDWIDAKSTIASGFICEVLATKICKGSECMNGGACVEIGCQKNCICETGYSGKYCEYDHIILQPLKNAYVINTGQKVVVTLNITSMDGPVTVKLQKSSDKTAISTKSNIISMVDFTFGPIWEIGIPIQYTFAASPDASPTLYTRKTNVNVRVREPKTPQSIETEVCRMEITVFFSPANGSVELPHRISILQRDNSATTASKDIVPKTSGKIQQRFNGLQPLTLYEVKITVCPDRCSRSSSRSKYVTMPAAIPSQVVRYMLVTKTYSLTDTDTSLTDTCILKWSVENTEITEFKIIATWQQLSGSQSDKEIKTLPGKTTELVFNVHPDRKYSFTIQATTCAGLGAALRGFGDCVTRIGVAATTSQGNTVSDSGSLAAATALAACFGVLFLAAAAGHLVIFWIRKNKKSNNGSDDPKGQVAPYQTTYFEESEENQTKDNQDYEVPMKFNSSESEFDSDPHDPDVQECPYQYENVQQSKSNTYVTASAPRGKLPKDMLAAVANLKPTILPRPKKIVAVSAPRSKRPKDVLTARANLKPTPPPKPKNK